MRKAPVALLPLAEETQPPVERPLSGKRVAFTGFTDPGAASECRSLVEALGGGAQSAVTKRTSVLVAAKGLTKKRLAAQQHGIPVVSTQWLRLGAEAPHEQFPVPWLVGYRLCLAMLEDDQREALTAVLRLHGAAIVPADAADTDAVLVGSEFARHLRGLPRRHRILPRRAASQEPAGRDRSVSLSVPRDTSMLGGAPVLDFAVFLRLARLSQEGDEDALLSAAGVRDRSDFDTIVAAGRIQPKSEAPAAPPRTLPAAALPGGLDGSASSSACSSSADDDDATLYVADGLTESAATPDYYESAGPEVEPPGLLGGQINVFYQAQKRAAAGDTQGQQQGPGRAIATLGARCDEGALFLAPPPEAWVPALAPATGPFLVVALLGHRGDELGAAMRCCAACRFLLVTCATRVADVIVLGSQLVQRKRTSAAKRRLRQLRDAGAAAVCWYEAHPEVAELAAECLGAHRSRIAPLAWLRECGARAQAAHRGGPLDPAVETAGEGGDSAPVVAPKESRAGARGGGFCLADAPPLGRGAFRIRFRAPQPQVATATATAPPSQLSSSGAPPVAGAIKEGGSAPATGSAAPLAVAASQPPPAAPRANYQEERQQAQSRLDGCLRLVRHAAVLPSQGERQCCVVAPAAALSDAARRVFRRGYFCLVEGDYARVEASVVRGLVGLGGGRWLKLKAAEWRGWLRSLSRSGRATTDETPPAAGAEARAFLDVVQAEMAERRRRRKERRSVCQMPSSALSTSPSPCGTPSESATRSGRPFVLQLVSHHYQRQPVSGQQPAEQRAKPIPYLQQATSDYVLCCMAAEALVPVNSLFLFHTPLPSAVELALRRHRCTNASQAQSSFSSPPTDSAAAPRLSTWVWQRRYEKPGAVGVSVSFVYRVPPSLMEVPGATDTAVAPAASLTQCSPSPRGLAIIKVLLLALHHAVQALGGSVQDAFRPDAVTHVILVDVAAVCPEDGDCGAQWPAADVHSIRSAPPGTVCLVTPRWLEDSVRWGAFIEEGDDSAYAWSLEYPSPILSPQMPAGGRGRTVSPAPRSLPLFDAAAAQRRSLSQRCTSVARRLREQLSPRQPGPPSASACRPAISTRPRTDSSPTAQRFDFETPGKAPRQAPTRPAERKHQLLGTDDGEADPRRSPAPQSQSGLPIDPQSQSGLQIDPQPQSGLPIDPQSQSGLQIDPQPQSGLQIDPQSQSGLPIDPQSQSGLPIDPQPQSGLQIDPQPQSGLQIDPQPQSGLPIDPQPQSGLQIDPQSQSGLQIDPQSQSGLQIDPQSQSGLPIDPQSQSGLPIDPQSQSGLQIDPQPQSGLQIDPQPQSGLPIDPQPQSGLQIDPQSQSGLPIDPQPQSGLQIDPQSQSGLQIDPQSQSGLQIDPQSQSGLQIDPQSQSGLQIDPQSQSGLQIDPQSQSGLQIDPQPQSGLPIDPQSQSGLPIDPQSQSGLPIDPQPQSGLPIDPQPQSGLQIDPQSQSGLQIDPQPQSGLQIDPQSQSGLQIDPQSQSGLQIDPQPQSGLPIDPQSQSGLPIDPQSQSGLQIDPSSALRSRDRKRQRSATPPPLQLVGRLLHPSPQPAPPPPPPAGLYQAPHPVEAPVCRCYILHDVPGRGAFLEVFEAVRRSGSAPVPAPGDVRVELADTAVGAAVVVTHEMRPRASLLAAVAAGAWMVTPAFLGDLSEALRRGGSLALQRDALDGMRGRHDWAVVAQLDDGRAGLPPATRLFLRRAAHYRAQRAVYGAAPFDGKTFVLWKGAAARRGAGDSQLEGVAQVISSGGGSVLCVVRAECEEEQAPAARMRICRPCGGGGDGAPLVVLPASAALESFLLFVIAFAAQRSAERTAPTGGQADPHHEVYLLFDGQLLESPVPIPAPRSTGGVTWRAWLQGLDFLEDGNDGGAMRLREAVERPPAEPWAEGALLALRSVMPCPPGRGGPPAVSKASHLRFTLATAEMRWVMDLLLSDGAGSSSASQSSQRRAGKNRHLLLTHRSLHIPTKSIEAVAHPILAEYYKKKVMEAPPSEGRGLIIHHIQCRRTSASQFSSGRANSAAAAPLLFIIVIIVINSICYIYIYIYIISLLFVPVRSIHALRQPYTATPPSTPRQSHRHTPIIYRALGCVCVMSDA
eukprot:gene336-187_t